MQEIPYPLLIELKAVLANRFSPAELSELAFALGILDYNIGGDTHQLKAQNLVTYLWRRGKLQELAQVGPRLNPSVDWAGLLARHGITLPSTEPMTNVAEPIINSRKGGTPMPIDSVTASILVASLPAMFEWFRPGVQGLTGRIGDAFGEVLQHRIYKRFAEEVSDRTLHTPADAPTPSAQKVAEQILAESTPLEAQDLLNKTKRVIIKVLRDPNNFSRSELEQLWLDYGNVQEPFRDMWERVGSTQASAAQEIVNEATRRRKVAALLDSMRRTMRRDD